MSTQVTYQFVIVSSQHVRSINIACGSFLTFRILLLQFIREYTGKVDELVKDRIESQNEVKAKEKEEKDVIAQQVKSSGTCLSVY